MKIIRVICLLICYFLQIAASTRPEQFKIAFGQQASEMLISFVFTSDATNATNSTTLYYGTQSGNLTNANNPSAVLGYPGLNGTIHQHVVSGLPAGQNYFYAAQDGAGGWSTQYNFTTAVNATVDGAVLGAMGLTTDARGVAQVIELLLPTEHTDFILHAGGAPAPILPPYLPGFALGNNDTWNQWGRMMEAITATVPYMPAPALVDLYQAYTDRFMTPGGSAHPYWYSFTRGSVQVFSISTEHDYRRGSPQYMWLDQALLDANQQRQQSPWLIVFGSRPMYSSTQPGGTGLFPGGGNAILRHELEPLFHKHGVDFAMWGGVTNYEQTQPVRGEISAGYRGSGTASDPYVNPSTIHFVVGTGGAPRNGNFIVPAPAWSAVRTAATPGAGQFHAYPNSTFGFHFWGFENEEFVWVTKDPNAGCPAQCSGHGTCSPVFQKCVCNDSYYGDDCSVFRADVDLVPYWSTWHYNAPGTPPTDTNWTALYYNDTVWSNGVAPFGAGAQRLYPSPQYPTSLQSAGPYQFRRHFTAPSAPPTGAVVTVKLYVGSSWGADVWLNGQQVDSDGSASNTPAAWNRAVSVNPALVAWGADNVLAALLMRPGGGGYFDANLVVSWTCPAGTFPPSCAVPTTAAATTQAVTTEAATTAQAPPPPTTIVVTTAALTTATTTGLQSSPVSHSSRSKGMSGGAVAAVVVIVLAAVGGAIAVAWLVWQRRRRAALQRHLAEAAVELEHKERQAAATADLT